MLLPNADERGRLLAIMGMDIEDLNRDDLLG